MNSIVWSKPFQQWEICAMRHHIGAKKTEDGNFARVDGFRFTLEKFGFSFGACWNLTEGSSYPLFALVRINPLSKFGLGYEKVYSGAIIFKAGKFNYERTWGEESYTSWTIKQEVIKCQ